MIDKITSILNQIWSFGSNTSPNEAKHNLKMLMWLAKFIFSFFLVTFGILFVFSKPILATLFLIGLSVLVCKLVYTQYQKAYGGPSDYEFKSVYVGSFWQFYYKNNSGIFKKWKCLKYVSSVGVLIPYVKINREDATAFLKGMGFKFEELGAEKAILYYRYIKECPEHLEDDIPNNKVITL